MKQLFLGLMVIAASALAGDAFGQCARGGGASMRSPRCAMGSPMSGGSSLSPVEAMLLRQQMQAAYLQQLHMQQAYLQQLQAQRQSLAAQATAKQQAADEARQARKAAKQQKLAAEKERRIEQNKLRQSRAGGLVSTTAP